MEAGNEEQPKDFIWEEVNSHILATLSHYIPELDFDPNSAVSVASVGCGMFFEAEALKTFFPNAKVTGYDRKKLITSATRKAWIPEDIGFVEGTVGEGVLEEGSNDVIVVRNPDIHYPEWRSALSECQKALKKNGILVATSYTYEEMEKIKKNLGDINIVKHEENFVDRSRTSPTHDAFVVIGQKK